MLGLTETPPRAWGRHALIQSVVPTCGNTPTCVGKTESPITYLPALWKHPHVRGEDPPTLRLAASLPETPPRAWGRLRPSMTSGFTPWKHPHVRGEDGSCAVSLTDSRETPPRAWGRLLSERIRELGGMKHPHVRGEDTERLLTFFIEPSKQY